MGWVLGGIPRRWWSILKEGNIRNLADTQDFDTGAIASLGVTPHHFEITCSNTPTP